MHFMMTSLLNLFNVMNVFAAAYVEPEITIETSMESLVEKIIHEKQEELKKHELNLKIFSRLKKGYTFLNKNDSQDVRTANELLEKTEDITTLIIDKLEDLNQMKATHLRNFSLISPDDGLMMQILKDCDDVEAEIELYNQRKEQMIKLTRILTGVIRNNDQVLDEFKNEQIRKANEEIDNIFEKLTSM